MKLIYIVDVSTTCFIKKNDIIELIVRLHGHTKGFNCITVYKQQLFELRFRKLM